ncbi:MAG: HNH endonuclease [Gemmatimonadota bacterium]|nr:HNH endonuclease [Gemmatimonadota bacterium]
MFFRLLLAACFCSSLFGAAHTHPGGLDNKGGHQNKATGEYHYHQKSVPYDRDLYKHWVDEDKDCQDARQEVLVAESTIPVTLDSSGCKVLSGRWECPYTGRVFTDPKRLDIDHYVPLAEVHRSGGNVWAAAQRESYANDLSNPNTLVAVYLGANRSKSDRDPSDWLPPDETYRCEYLRTWVALKKHWGLSMDPKEKAFIDASDCFNEKEAGPEQEGK